jgi:capsular polysaccharide biosynthesis protein
MTLKLDIEDRNSVDLGAYYERVAGDTAKVLWRRKWLIAAFLPVLPSLAFLALVLMGPRYTAEAMIELGFSRKGAALEAKAQETVATVDASVLVDSAARLLRSRPIAAAAAVRLGLDKDPRYTRNPLLLQALTYARSVLGVPEADSTPLDRATNELLRRVSATAQPRSYVISIAATAHNPEDATALVNAVALAYLKVRMAQEIAAAASEMKQATEIYGAHHPRYQLAEMKLQGLEAELNALDGGPKGGAKVVAGVSFIAGDVIVGPSGQQIIVVLGGALAIGLAFGIWMALYGRGRKRRFGEHLHKFDSRDRSQVETWETAAQRVARS